MPKLIGERGVVEPSFPWSQFVAVLDQRNLAMEMWDELRAWLLDAAEIGRTAVLAKMDELENAGQ